MHCARRMVAQERAYLVVVSWIIQCEGMFAFGRVIFVELTRDSGGSRTFTLREFADS